MMVVVAMAVMVALAVAVVVVEEEEEEEKEREEAKVVESEFVQRLREAVCTRRGSATVLSAMSLVPLWVSLMGGRTRQASDYCRLLVCLPKTESAVVVVVVTVAVMAATGAGLRAGR